MYRFKSLLKAVLCASTLSVLVNVSMAMAEPTDSDYLEKARVLAEKGDADAQLMLGIYKYNQGMHGSDEAAKEAIEWLNKAAAKGNSGAEFYLGAAYNTGTGVEKKPDRAVEWWQKAAKHGISMPRLLLAVCISIAVMVIYPTCGPVTQQSMGTIIQFKI
jgi:TPR repeat protein